MERLSKVKEVDHPAERVDADLHHPDEQYEAALRQRRLPALPRATRSTTTRFIGVILKNFAERNPAPIPKNLWGYPEGVKGYDFDLTKALR